MKTIAMMQSDRIRNAHRLSEIQDAKQSLDELERDIKAALEPILAKHGLKPRDMALDLSMRTGAKLPTFDGNPAPAGFLSCGLDVVNG
jgi:hypothetical protein